MIKMIGNHELSKPSKINSPFQVCSAFKKNMVNYPKMMVNDE